MVNDRARRRTLALVAVVVVVSLSGCIDFPPSHVVCISCEEGIEAAAGEDANLSVTDSELRIAVRENGSSRWTVRSDLTGEDVTELQSDPDRVDRLADRAVTDSVGRVAPTIAIHDGRVHDRTARLDGETLMISFTVRDAGRRSFGDVLLVDYFNSGGTEPGRWGLGTDRIVVRGPPGTVLTDHPTVGTPTDDGRGVVFEDAATGVPGNTYLAFAPDDRTTTKLRADLAVAADTAGWLVPTAFRTAWGFALVLFGSAVALTARANGGVSFESGPAAATALRAWIADELPIETVLVPAAAVIAGVSLAVGGGGPARALFESLVVDAPVLPLLLFLVLGYVSRRPGRVRRVVLLTIGCVPFVMASPVVASIPQSPFYDSVHVSDALLGPIAATIAIGALLFYVGRFVSE